MNWGYKLLCTFIVFIGGMGFLVYRSMSTEFQLVEKEYYKKELNYQTVIDGQHKANSLSMPVKVTSKDAEVVLEMPSELKGAVISGRVWFYCANDASKDKLFDMSVDSNGQQVFAAGLLRPGKYLAKLEWKADDVSYYTEIPVEI
ncbi:MAG: FixH family protein [Chitinophagaceae bacterium]|nr:FixH family protein [Chitinophagaceae bacterium]